MLKVGSIANLPNVSCNLMRTFIADIFPKIQRFSKKLDQLTILTNHHWVSLSDIANSKTVFIFRPNNQILFSENGLVEKGTWEYLGNQSILLERQNKSYLLKHAFVDDDILALKLDSLSGYAVFINETKFGREINTIEDVVRFLETKYIKKSSTTSASKTVRETASTDTIKTPSFEETQPKENYDLFNGRHYIVSVKFDNGLTGDIYLGGKSKKYFLQYGFNGIQYFDTKKECIDYLYKQLHKTINYS